MYFKNVTLLGLYTLHEGLLTFLCDTVIPKNIVLSMVHHYMIDYVNENVLNNTGITLNTILLDTCDNATITLQKIVGAISTSHIFCDPWDVNNKDNNNPMLAATGIFSGEIGANVNYLLRAFCLPVLASTTSSGELDNPSTYPYFMRAGSSDTYKAQVIFDILQSQQWYHINIFYDSSSFGVALTDEFKNIISYCDGTDYENHDSLKELFRTPCVENYFQLSVSYPNDTLNVQLDKLERLLKVNTAKVSLILMEDIGIEFILEFFKTHGFDQDNMQFIIPNRRITVTPPDLLTGTIAIEEAIDELDILDELVRSYNISTSPNDYVTELIEEQNLCCLENDTKCPYSITCEGYEMIKNIPAGATHEARNVYNAIMIIASALKAIHENYCESEKGICENLMKHYTGNLLLQYMLNATFIDDRGQTFTVFNRAALPVYNVFVYNDSLWHPVLLNYNPYDGAIPSDLYYDFSETDKQTKIQEELEKCQSLCHQAIPDIISRCCWVCIPCGEGEIINTTLQMCQNCSSDKIPNATLTGCKPEPIPPLFYTPTVEMYILIGLSTLGIVCSCLLAVYIYIKRTTPIAKASTPDLCYMQAATQILLFVMSVFMLPTSSIFICAIAWTVSTTLLLITHAIFLIKAIRLSRPKFYTKLISYTNTPAKSSVVMLVIIFIAQLLVCGIWILLRPPTISKTKDHYKYCSSNDEIQTTVLMILPMSMVIATFYFQKNAIKNKIMFQVRQARIGLAGTLCFIVNYIILLPLIFMENSPQYVRSTILMCIPILTAYVSLTTMQLPVSYELFIRKKQNSHEYVSRERSRQFQAGNMVYYVDAMIVNRSNRTRTQTRENSIT